MIDRVQDFPSMLRGALGERLSADAVSFIDMLAEDALMEFPFAPPGLPKRLEGRDAIGDHLMKLARLISFDRIGQATVVACGAETTVLTFEAVGVGVETGAVYDQHYVSIITTFDGSITRYVDYWNPLPVIRALLGDEAADAIVMGDIYHD